MSELTSTQERHKAKLLIYLGNPENEWLTRMKLSTEVLGFSQENQIHKVFSPDEIHAIEMEALELRRKKYSRLVNLVDMALLKKAAEGDTQAAKLVYQRISSFIFFNPNGSCDNNPAEVVVSVGRHRKERCRDTLPGR
jgi:hypothetical protein